MWSRRVKFFTKKKKKKEKKTLFLVLELAKWLGCTLLYTKHQLLKA